MVAVSPEPAEGESKNKQNTTFETAPFLCIPDHLFP